jgi:hypothetical protein
LLVIAACAHPHPVAPAEDTDDDDIPDEVDRCPIATLGCFLDAGDDDGCPDAPVPPRVHLPLGHDDRALLVEMAAQARALDPGVSVIVVGHALPNEPPGPALERATAVALRLEDDGVPLERLLARAAPPLAPDDRATVELTTIGCAPAATMR